MNEMVFLYKDDSECRDCCAYIEATPSKFECGHYFSSVKINGACYTSSDFAEYKNIRTVLTESEYNQLLQFAENIKNLGYGITEGDERYTKGIELCEAVQPIYDKLLSNENKIFFEEIQEEETEFLMDEYGFDLDDIKTIFDNYSLEYRDRAIVRCIYKDIYDLGEEEAYSLGFIKSGGKDIVSKYFDFEKFGKDLTDNEEYCELSDGRVVGLCY